MPLPDAPDYSKRIYELLKETDLENLSYAQFQGVAEKLFIEPENEDEMRRLVLVQLARMAVRGDWDGFLTGGGGSGGAPTDAEYVVMALNGTLTNERKLTAGARITITDGGGGGNVTIAADASPVTKLVAGTNITLSPATGLGDVTITAASGSVTFPLEAPNGSAAAPSYSFSGDTDTGMFLTSSNTLSFSTAGTERLRASASGVQAIPLGSVGTPSISFQGQTNTGFFRPATSEVAFSAAGVETFRFGADGDIEIVGDPGSAGQVLTSNGVGSAAQWSTPAGGTDTFQQSVLPGTIINSGSDNLFLVSKMGIWGNRGTSAGTYNGTATPHFFPFTNPVAGDIDHISINISGDGTGVYGFAIYRDSNGVPVTKLGGDMSYTGGTGGTGREDLTPASTVTLEQGKQYWLGVVETSTGNTSLTAEAGSDVCGAHPISSSTSNLSAIATLASLTLSSSANTLPATVTAANLAGDFQPQIRWGIVYA
ncbi:MAG: tail fiber protein [Circular genetic element sp.]|nr:MAG: tail fiber protein [Circular genetic element sp.]